MGPLEFCSWTASATYDDFAERGFGLVEKPAPPTTIVRRDYESKEATVGAQLELTQHNPPALGVIAA